MHHAGAGGQAGRGGPGGAADEGRTAGQKSGSSAVLLGEDGGKFLAKVAGVKWPRQASALPGHWCRLQQGPCSHCCRLRCPSVLSTACPPQPQAHRQQLQHCQHSHCSACKHRLGAGMCLCSRRQQRVQRDIWQAGRGHSCLSGGLSRQLASPQLKVQDSKFGICSQPSLSKPDGLPAPPRQQQTTPRLVQLTADTVWCHQQLSAMGTAVTHDPH